MSKHERCKVNTKRRKRNNVTNVVPRFVVTHEIINNKILPKDTFDCDIRHSFIAVHKNLHVLPPYHLHFSLTSNREAGLHILVLNIILNNEPVQCLLLFNCSLSIWHTRMTRSFKNFGNLLNCIRSWHDICN